MVYKLIISKEAHKDTDDIVNYIAIELDNITAAISFVDDVESSYKSVVNNPRMYAICDDEKKNLSKRCLVATLANTHTKNLYLSD